MQTLTEQLVKCGSCLEKRPEGDLSECTVCDAKFCGACSQCDCDRIGQLTQELTALANNTGQHRELLASLRVVYNGLKPALAAA
jgi:hypothetical protein